MRGFAVRPENDARSSAGYAIRKGTRRERKNLGGAYAGMASGRSAPLLVSGRADLEMEVAGRGRCTALPFFSKTIEKKRCVGPHKLKMTRFGKAG
jgi:hypothetical protein